MWFKNLRLYRFTESFAMSPEALGEKLAEHSFQPCGSLDQSRYGWVPPLGRQGSDFVHAANGNIMVCAKHQQKVLPAAAVNEALEERIGQISQQEGRPVARRERQDLKDEIIFSMMPQAFTKSSLNYAYIAPQQGLLIVNAASAKRAEDLLSAMREALGSLPAIPVTAKHIPTQVMTQWLREGELPQGFQFADECELISSEDGSTVRCKNMDMTADEVRGHLESGMHVKRLALQWNQAIRFTVDDELAVKRVKFEDAIQDKADEQHAETVAEQFDVDFAIMTVEIEALLQALLAAFGGESQQV